MDDEEILDTYDNDTDSVSPSSDIFDTPIDFKSNVEDVISFMKNYETNKETYKTKSILSKYERTRILSERAQQLEDGSHPYISNVDRFTSSYSIALEEFNTKKLPFIIRRSIPHSNSFEYWKLKDMIY